MKKHFLFILLSAAFCFICAGCSIPGASAGFQANSALLADDGAIDVIWTPADDADQYEIYRAAEEDGEYTLIGTAEGDKNYYSDYDVELHETYWYKVRYSSGDKMSEFSDVVAGYVSDESIYNGDMTFEIEFRDGDSFESEAGMGSMGSNAYDLTIIPKLKGEPITDSTVYYDKSSLEMTPSETGAYALHVLQPGNQFITFSSGEQAGTFAFEIEKRPTFDNDFFMTYWHQYNAEKGLSDYFYPDTKNSVLYMRHNGTYVSDIDADSSNPEIAEVSVSDGKVYVTNKSIGVCELTLKGSGNKGVITWVVTRGKALDQPAIEGVPISANIDREKAEEAINIITASDYSEEDMQSMAEKDFSLEEWQKKLSKPADVIHMLRALNFNDENDDSEKIDNDDVESNGRYWMRKLSPEGNFEQRFLVCLSTCEMMNYLLRNDMKEQGYVEYADPGGGHTLCYYKINGLYVFCDFVDSIAGRDWPDTFYVKYVCDDLQDFTDFYVYGEEQNDPKRPGYIDVLYMFPMEGRAIPAASDDSAYHIEGTSVMSVLPETWNGKDINDLVTILFRAPGFHEQYAPGPDESLFPEK